MKIVQRIGYFYSRNIANKITFNALKFSFYTSIFPVASASIFLYLSYSNNNLFEYLSLILIIYFAVFVSVLPLFKDYNSLSNYFSALSLNRFAKFPNLRSSKSLSDLIESLKIMSQSWEQSKTLLSHQLIESKLIFDTIPDIILVVNSEFIVIKANEQISDIYKKNPVGENILDVVKNPLIEGCIRWVFHDKSGKQLEVSIDSKDGLKFFFAKIEYYQLDDDTRDYAVILLQDITEIKRTEKMFSDFISNASHEIKTPLASIIGVVETLQHTGKDDPEAIQEFMPVLQSQALRMSALISDLLNLAKIEKMLNSPPDDEVDIREVIGVAIENLKWVTQKGQNKISVHGISNIPKIIADRSQLIQVMENLISNASKYGGFGKEIKIDYGITDDIPKNNIFIGTVKKALYIAVADSGEGIPKRYIPRLTERFFRVDKSRSTKIGGTGLGLAIVRQILNRHEAILDIKSKIGVGSTFKVLFALK